MEERKARGNSRGKGTGRGRGRGRGRGSGRDSDKEKGIAENQDEIENGEEEEGGVGTGDSDVRSYKYYREVNANRIGDERGRAAWEFGCPYSNASPFRAKEDPFNPGNTLTGYICRCDGIMGGSLYITKVNDKPLKNNLLIYGTPKLAYPYIKGSSEVYKDFSYEDECKSFLLTNKWDGTNVLVFKYTDAAGKNFISMKSKGSVYLTNGPFGAFATLAKKVLGIRGPRDVIAFNSLPEALKELAEENIRSKTFELVGNELKHLVKYEFGLEMKGLFITYTDGTISPCRESEVVEPFDQDKLVLTCTKYQKKAQEENVAFRAANGMVHKYEHDHFMYEGQVLYVLDAAGKVIERTMYKIKPRDIEEVHWASFGHLMQGRVREALEKIASREKKLTQETLQEETDMGPKEWDRFGKHVWKYASEMAPNIPPLSVDKRRLLIIGGYPASGKSEFVDYLRKHDKNWIAFAGDTSLCKEGISEHYKHPNARIAIEKYCLTKSQRKLWVEEGRKYGILTIEFLFFEADKDQCIAKRKGQPDTPEEANQWHVRVSRPLDNEGFCRITFAKEGDDLAALLKKVVAAT